MRILAPTKGLGELNDLICRHFGQAANFVVVIVEKGRIKGRERYPNKVQTIKPRGAAAERTAQFTLDEARPDLVLVGLIDEDAGKVFEVNKIKVVKGLQGQPIRKAVLEQV